MHFVRIALKGPGSVTSQQTAPQSAPGVLNKVDVAGAQRGDLGACRRLGARRLEPGPGMQNVHVEQPPRGKTAIDLGSSSGFRKKSGATGGDGVGSKKGHSPTLPGGEPIVQRIRIALSGPY